MATQQQVDEQQKPDDKAVEKVKLYLDYLKIEMSIMGILSAFCVAAVSLVLKQVLEAESEKYLATVWAKGNVLMMAGTLLMLIAALFFYRQRSRLATLYGALCVTVIMPEDVVESTNSLIDETGEWWFWLYYRIAFAFVVSAMVDFMLALISPMAQLPSSARAQLICAGASAAVIGLSLFCYEKGWLKFLG